MIKEDSNLDHDMVGSNGSNAVEPFNYTSDETSTSVHDSDSVSKLKTILGFTMHIVRLGVQIFLNIWRFKH